MKLEEIGKNNIFNVPEGYFDRLPGQVQSRISGTKKEIGLFLRFRLQYVLPALIAIMAIVWLFPSKSQGNVDAILASVETDDMISYLVDSDLSTDEVLELIQLSAAEVDGVESEVYQLESEDATFDDFMLDAVIDTL